MARFKERKNTFLEICMAPSWKQDLETLLGAGSDRTSCLPVEAARASDAKEAVSPLLALLPRPELRWQAAYGLGLAVSALARTELESSRVIMRRLMWSLNEESGNIGWGIPEAMGCILSLSPPLALEYSRILISYGYETGKDDNFLDHAPLRAGVYWAIAYLAMNNPAAARPALEHLTSALSDGNAQVMGMAAFAHAALAQHVPPYGLDQPGRRELWTNALHTLNSKITELPAGQSATELEYFDSERITQSTLGALLHNARRAAAELLGAEAS